MNVQAQALKAEQLRKLHSGPKMLVLPNAWDVASARPLATLGQTVDVVSSASPASYTPRSLRWVVKAL